MLGCTLTKTLLFSFDLLGKRCRQLGCSNEAYATVDEKKDIPEGGSEFHLPPELLGKVPKALCLVLEDYISSQDIHPMMSWKG